VIGGIDTNDARSGRQSTFGNEAGPNSNIDDYARWIDIRCCNGRITNTFTKEGAAHFLPFVGNTFEIFAAIVTHNLRRVMGSTEKMQGDIGSVANYPAIVRHWRNVE